MAGIDYSRWERLEASSEEESESSQVDGVETWSDLATCTCCGGERCMEAPLERLDYRRAAVEYLDSMKARNMPPPDVRAKLETMGKWFLESESSDVFFEKMRSIWGNVDNSDRKTMQEQPNKNEKTNEKKRTSKRNGKTKTTDEHPVEKAKKQTTLLKFYRGNAAVTTTKKPQDKGKGTIVENENRTRCITENIAPHCESTETHTGIPKAIDSLLLDTKKLALKRQATELEQKFGYWAMRGKLFDGGKLLFRPCAVFQAKEIPAHRQRALLAPVRADHAKRIAMGHPDPMRALDRAAAPCLMALRNAHCPFDGPLLHSYCLGGSTGDSLEVFRRCPTVGKLLKMGPMSLKEAENAIHNLRLSVVDLPRLVLLSLDQKLHDQGSSILKSKKQMNAKGSARKKYLEVFAPIHAIRSLAELGEGGGGLLPLLDVDIPLELWDPELAVAVDRIEFGDLCPRDEPARSKIFLALSARDPFARYLAAACVNEQIASSSSDLWGGVLQALLEYAMDDTRWLVGRMRALVAADCLFAWDLDPLLPESLEHKDGLPLYLVGEGRRISMKARELIVLAIEKILGKIGVSTPKPLAVQAVNLRAWSWSRCMLCHQTGGGGPQCKGCGKQICFRCFRNEADTLFDDDRLSACSRWCHLCVGNFDSFPQPEPSPKPASLDYMDAAVLLGEGLFGKFKGNTLKILWGTAGLFEVNEDKTMTDTLHDIKWDNVCHKMYEPMLRDSNLSMLDEVWDKEIRGISMGTKRNAPSILIQVSEQVDEMVDIIMGHGSEGWNILSKRYKRLVSAVDHHFASPSAPGRDAMQNASSVEVLLVASGASASKTLGTQLFKQGKYLPALVAYADAIAAVVVLCVSAAVFGAVIDPNTGARIVSQSGMQSTITFANMTIPLYLACLLNAALIGNLLCKEENATKFGDRWDQEDLAMASCRCCNIALDLLGVDFYNSLPECRNGMYTSGPPSLPSGIIAGCSVKTWIAKALFRRGQALVHAGVLEQAEADLRAAEALVPSDPAISEERKTVSRARGQLLSPEERKKEKARRKKEKKKAKTKVYEPTPFLSAPPPMSLYKSTDMPGEGLHWGRFESDEGSRACDEKAQAQETRGEVGISAEERKKERQRKKKEKRKAKKGSGHVDDVQETEPGVVTDAVSRDSEKSSDSGLATAGERTHQDRLRAKREKKDAIKAQRRAEAEAAAAAKKKRLELEAQRKKAEEESIAAAEAAHRAALERAREMAEEADREREALLLARQKELDVLRQLEYEAQRKHRVEQEAQAKAPKTSGPKAQDKLCPMSEHKFTDKASAGREYGSRTSFDEAQANAKCSVASAQERGNVCLDALESKAPSTSKKSELFGEIKKAQTAVPVGNTVFFDLESTPGNTIGNGHGNEDLTAAELDALTFGDDAVQAHIQAYTKGNMRGLQESAFKLMPRKVDTNAREQFTSAKVGSIDYSQDVQVKDTEIQTVSSVVTSLPGFDDGQDEYSVPVEDMINQMYCADVPVQHDLSETGIGKNHGDFSLSQHGGSAVPSAEDDFYAKRYGGNNRGSVLHDFSCPSFGLTENAGPYHDSGSSQSIWTQQSATGPHSATGFAEGLQPSWPNQCEVPYANAQGTWQSAGNSTGTWIPPGADNNYGREAPWVGPSTRETLHHEEPWAQEGPGIAPTLSSWPSSTRGTATELPITNGGNWGWDTCWGLQQSGAAPSTAADDLCAICRVRRKNTLPVPCGHVCGCFECLVALQQTPGQGRCPVCQTPMQSVQRIILS